MFNENDLQEFLLIAEDDISEQSWRNYPKGSKRYEEGKAKAEAEAKAIPKNNPIGGGKGLPARKSSVADGDGEKAKATKTKADFKKGEFEIVGTAPNQMKKDAEGNLTRLTKKDTASKELDIDSKPKMKPKKMSMLDRVKAIKQGKSIDSSGKQRNDPSTEKDVRATNINRKNSAGKIDTQAILPSANPTGKVSGKAPTALGRQADRQAKDMMGPGAGSAAPKTISAVGPKKAGPSKDDYARQGIRGGTEKSRAEVAAGLAKMRAERKPRPETKRELATDYAARQSPKVAADGKPKFVAQKGGQTPSQKAASRSGADISTNSAGPSRPATRTGSDLSAPKIRPAPKPAATTKDADELDAAPAPKIASPRPPKPPKKPKQSALDKAVADNARFQTDESKDFKVQSMREALEDVWRNGATVQENLRSSKDKGMRVLRTGKTMTGGRPAVIETNPKDPTSRNMGMTNEEFAIRDLTESMTDEEYQLFEISASSALSLAKTFGKIPKGITAAQIRAMAKEYGIDLSELEGSISDMMRGNFDNVTYKGKPIPSKVKSGVINSFMKAGGVKKIGKGSVKAAAKEAGKFAKGEDEPKLSSAVKRRRDEVLGTEKKGSNASEPKKVDTKKPDSEKDSEKVTRGRDKDGTPYVQKDITKDMEKLNKMKPKSDGAPDEKDDEFLSDPKFKGKSKKEIPVIKITKYRTSDPEVDKSDDDKASRRGDAVPKKPKEGGEELDAAPAPSAPKDKKKEPKKKKEPEKKKDDPTEGGKYAYYEKDPKKRTKNSAMYMTQKGYDDENEKADGESFNAVDATSNFLSNISKDDTMYSWSLSTKK